jgi:hypothetical protein
MHLGTSYPGGWERKFAEAMYSIPLLGGNNNVLDLSNKIVRRVPRSFHFSSEILLNAGTSAGGELAKVSTETARRKLKTSFGRLYPPHN